MLMYQNSIRKTTLERAYVIRICKILSNFPIRIGFGRRRSRGRRVWGKEGIGLTVSSAGVDDADWPRAWASLPAVIGITVTEKREPAKGSGSPSRRGSVDTHHIDKIQPGPIGTGRSRTGQAKAQRGPNGHICALAWLSRMNFSFLFR